MQPPPRAGPPGASGPPPSGPNMYRRTRPHKHAAGTSTRPPAAQPTTDPFAFVGAPPPMAAGGVPTLPNSHPPPLQAPNAMYAQAGPGLPPQQQGVPAAPHGPAASLPGVAFYNPHDAASHNVFQPPSAGGFAPSPHGEQGYFNSREQTSSTAPEPLHVASGSAPSQTPFNRDFHGPPPPQPFQPVPPTASSSQWAPDHGSRPPSVQNYFQPTSDPPPQPFHLPPQTQVYPSHTPSPHHSIPAPPTQIPLPLQSPVKAPASQWAEPQASLLHNAQNQSYFSQSSAPQDAWFNQHPQDSGYHQMGSGLSHPQPRPDSAPSTGPGPGPGSAASLGSCSQESGTLSMFFKDNDVENEETLAEERNKAVNGSPGSFPHHSHLHAYAGHADVPLDYQGPLQDHSRVPYMNEGNYASQGIAQKAPESQDDHVENLECVPNQEVLPSGAHGSPASPAAHGGDHFETGPNLETPDSVTRPMRSASVSSSYSSMSHGSGAGVRRHQGVVGTFIQQESPRLTDEASLSAATGGYFEQVDTCPSGDGGAQQSSLEQMWPPTPSPPKPTGVFQASANSSFEPVRSHGVGVRPPEVDRAKMVAERGADSTPGNLEHPPDNMENVYRPGPPLQAVAGDGVPHVTFPVVPAHSRPSSRALGASRPCESPATTLWAQNDPASLGANILLAPAAPTVLAPLRGPSADVIQPPEDAPPDLQPSPRTQPTSQQHSENLENPPKVSEAEPTDSQGNLGYASLLVSDSLQQAILIAPPASSYSVIPQSAPPQSAGHGSLKEATPPQGQGAGPSLPPPLHSTQNPLIAAGQLSFNSSVSNPVPLNLTREKTEGTRPDVPTPPQSQPGRCPIPGDAHSALQGNPEAPPVAAAVRRHNQPSNYELLDFSMHQSQSQSQASGPPSSAQEPPQPSNGFYLQVTKDAQQGLRGKAPVPTAVSSAPPRTAADAQTPPAKPPNAADSQVALQQHKVAASVPLSEAQPPHGQFSPPAQDAVEGKASYPPAPREAAPAQAPRPPSSAGSQQGYGPPAPAPAPGLVYGGYYGNYGDFPEGRAPYLPGQYPPPPGDPRVQQYYQDGYGSRSDPWRSRYEGQAPAYRDPNYQYREPQPERPSSRTSQYSDRPSSRQGHPDDYPRANRSAYSDYYADYAKHYDYGGYNYGQYDPQYREYYDQAYWSNYDAAYRGRDAYYNQHVYPARKEAYDDQWRYYPGYDASFDDDYRRRGEMCADDFDRRSVHSEQSAHSSHSSHGHHSRRSSFSSRSQQSQVYRSQPDLVSAVYDATSSTLAADYSYGQYPNQPDASQNYGQYLYPSEYTAESTWIAPEQPPPRPATPEKFTIPHRCARFGPGGHLVQVLPNLPSAGQPALVDIHSVETMLLDTPEQTELRAFPGPLVKEETHKVDVIKFSQSKALESSRDTGLLDRDSARLLWDFIMLLCRQNGTVVGTDIADLLLKEHRSVWLPGKSPNEANLIDFNNEPLARAEEEPGAGPLSLLSDTFMTVPENVGKETERFRELLLFGRKKDALEAAMKGGLWGHALLLASKMDSRTHARVMTRFANSLPINDPLQTVYQLMSGRMPASATCCGEEKWGDWRPHLAMVLSNLTHTLDLDTRTISTMGDTLASKGLIDAAHFCYLMAQVGLGVFTKKSTKMVLIGSNHSLPFHQFASNEAIQRTEAYEYAQALGSHPCSLPNFQVFKLIYACRLAEAGLSAQAFHYCEVISRAVLGQPGYHAPVFISQIVQMSEKLRFFDPQLKEKPEQELFDEPDWLIQLRALDGQIRTGDIKYNEDRMTPSQFDCSTPSSDPDQPSPTEPYGRPTELDGPTQDNPLMTSLLPGPPQQGVQLMPPAPTSILQDGMAPPQPPPPTDVPQFYTVPPSGQPGQMPVSRYPPQDAAFAPPPFHPHPHEQTEIYPGSHPQPLPLPAGQMSPHMMPHSPVQINPPPLQMAQHMPPSPSHMPPAPLDMHHAPPMSSPPRRSFTPQTDLYDRMAQMGPVRRTRTASQSSSHMASGRRSRTTSESSTHSGGRERSNSIIQQVAPPPPPIPEQPRGEQVRKGKKDSPKKGGGVNWFKSLLWKGKSEAHLPDDTNKSIVWDQNQQKWVDLNEPEEESKPPPPPPSGFPMMPQKPGPGGPPAAPSGGPPVNIFSRRAGTRSRYVDVLNPGRAAKPGGSAPAPADMFAPLAPMAMPANLFVPSSAPDPQPLEGVEGGDQEQSPPPSAAPQMFNPTLLPPAPEAPPAPDGSQSGELSRSSSMSSLSREVTRHLNQTPVPAGGVTFYNPAQFAQTSAPPGHRPGRLGGQRQYPVLK
ncbi:protein transport protein Sec16A [Brachionichthys hirsutus]|uniref:protein transport protein Sec16A n=1 Tax=Brachionichthys hirsutus TaxID=412623 RepID=UPI003604AA77